MSAQSRFAQPPKFEVVGYVENSDKAPPPAVTAAGGFSPAQARAPKGSPGGIGGEWIDAIRGILGGIKEYFLPSGNQDPGPGTGLVESEDTLPRLAGDHSHITGTDTIKGTDIPYGDDVAEAANAAYDKYVALEPQVTRDITDALAEGGMDPSGLEFRLKEPGSLGRKIKDDIPTKGSASSAAAGMFDGVRYTGVAPSGEYAAKSQAALDALRRKGYTNIRPIPDKNFWGHPDNPYRGINVQLLGPRGEQIELQFHTPESLPAKFKMHPIFEDWRVLPDKTTPEALAMYDEMWAISNTLVEPPGVRDIT